MLAIFLLWNLFSIHWNNNEWFINENGVGEMLCNATLFRGIEFDVT